jgi:hypothetical protein
VPPRDPAAFLVVSQGEFQRATQAASLFSVSGRTPVSARRAGYAEIGTSEVGVFLYKNGNNRVKCAQAPPASHRGQALWWIVLNSN